MPRHEVTVYGLNRIQYTTDAYLGLPTDILGTEYIVLGWNDRGFRCGTELAVAGTPGRHDRHDHAVGDDRGSQPAGTPYTVNLNPGRPIS